MGSASDWDKTMSHASRTLASLKIPHEVEVISAHRAPRRLEAYAAQAESRGLQVIIAGAGGAAHLPGVTASLTYLPVIGVPCMGWALDGADSLYSIAQMPGGVPVATMAVGKAGAINAALFACQILGTREPAFKQAFAAFRDAQAATITTLEPFPFDAPSE